LYDFLVSGLPQPPLWTVSLLSDENAVGRWEEGYVELSSLIVKSIMAEASSSSLGSMVDRKDMIEETEKVCNDKDGL
jgi:hypothetical protein